MEDELREQVLMLLRLVLSEDPRPVSARLRDADGRRLPADASFPDARVIVSVRDEEEPETEDARRRHVADVYDVRYVVVAPRVLTGDPRDDAWMLQELLGVTHAPAVDELFAQWDAEEAEDEWDEDDDRDPYGFEAQRAAAAAQAPADPHALPLDHPEVRFGWRGRAIGLALLGAAAMSRRAFQGRGDLRGASLEVLAALTLGLDDDPSDAGLDDHRLAVVTARSRAQVDDALYQLRDRGLVERTEYEGDPPAWRATEAGRAAILDWLGRVAPLVGDWPPPPPGGVEP